MKVNEPIIEITTVEHFIAQIIAMKSETEDRLTDLTNCLEAHNNFPAADIFRNTIDLITKMLDELHRLSDQMELPEIKPWDAQWHCEEQADCLCMEQAHYLMTPLQAHQLALFNETRISQFCEILISQTKNKEIKQFSQIVLKKQNAQLDQMQQWIEPLKELSEPVEEDFDPPNMPE